MRDIIFGDCMEIMPAYTDGYFDLAIVDPPYGIGVAKKGYSLAATKTPSSRTAPKFYGIKDWDDSAPGADYFNELRRISKNQIIWGGNYFLDHLPSTSCFIVWDKENGKWSNADCELAWTSFKTAVRKFSFRWNGMLQGNMKQKEDRIHPTQKPVQLYNWLYHHYAKKDFKVIDTHLGSGSNAIAAHYFGIQEFIGIERDADYYRDASQRLTDATRQAAFF